MQEIQSAAWDSYSASQPQRRLTNAKGETTWFNWTQYPDHGPGVELLSLSAGGSVLDLGCGAGGNLAHLASIGMQGTGVDLSIAQLGKARQRWGSAGFELHQAEALGFLAQSTRTFDAVYSVFGAAYFTDPDRMLPAVHARLAQGGVFALSQRPAVEGCYGCQASYIPRGDDEDPAIVRRWDFSLVTWEALLKEYGFKDVTTSVLPAPVPGRRTIGTLLVSGRRA
ncbi:class I SAM-dependent methyltransferase [Kitasatospora sp. NPDC002040]|uniref:class I SAM-dependent methyltransferase n=1 Tax=Kitasatospora sp. NPDC002040 TaxID=3154661 RepID=UPI00332CC91A